MTLTASRCLPVKPRNAVRFCVNSDGVRCQVEVHNQAEWVRLCPPLLNEEGPSFEGPSSFIELLGDLKAVAKVEPYGSP